MWRNNFFLISKDQKKNTIIAKAKSWLMADVGVLYTWGRGTDGQLGEWPPRHYTTSAITLLPSRFLTPFYVTRAGQDEAEFPRHNCALPHPVAGIPENVVAIACGSGNQGCTAVVGESGTLFTFGSNFKGRLGHSEAASQRVPKVVEALRGIKVVGIAAGTEHMLCVTNTGTVYAWGSNAKGCCGRSPSTASMQTPSLVSAALGGKCVSAVDCDNNASAALCSDGTLFMWGDNTSGRLGVGDKSDRPTPTRPVEHPP